MGERMQIYKAKDYLNMSRKAANIISAQIIMKPDCTLGLATGTSPIGTYDQLVEWFVKGDLDFSHVRTVNLDEYVGLHKDNRQSYHYFMNKHLFSRININHENINIPDGKAKDIKAECERYNQVLQAFGGIDLQLLGIGHNGHIGFNEPGEAFEKETHCVNLTQDTITANSRLFGEHEEVPKQALTMGIKAIMQAKKILLIASGKGKAKIIERALMGPITPQIPASILQLHNNVIIVGDEDALALI